MRNAIPSIYACGTMSGLSVEQAEGWRLDMAEKLYPEIIVYSPMRYQFATCKPDQIIQNSYAPGLLCTDKAIVSRDKNDVKSSDLLFVNLSLGNQVSIGSLIEIGWANAWQIPIMLYIDKTNEDQLKLYNHPFIRELVSFVVYDYDEAIELIHSVLLE